MGTEPVVVPDQLQTRFYQAEVDELADVTRTVVQVMDSLHVDRDSEAIVALEKVRAHLLVARRSLERRYGVSPS